MYRVATSDITPGMVLEADIFKDSRESHRNLPLLCDGSTVTAKFLYMLKSHGVKHVFTRNPSAFGRQYADPKFRQGENPHAILGFYMEKSKSVITPRTKDEVLKTMQNFHISLNGLDEEE